MIKGTVEAYYCSNCFANSYFPHKMCGVCMCVRERERERHRKKRTLHGKLNLDIKMWSSRYLSSLTQRKLLLSRVYCELRIQRFDYKMSDSCSQLGHFRISETSIKLDLTVEERTLVDGYLRSSFVSMQPYTTWTMWDFEEKINFLQNMWSRAHAGSGVIKWFPLYRVVSSW